MQSKYIATVGRLGSRLVNVRDVECSMCGGVLEEFMVGVGSW